MQTVVCNMISRMSVGGEPSGKCRWKLRVDKETHQVTRNLASLSLSPFKTT